MGLRILQKYDCGVTGVFTAPGSLTRSGIRFLLARKAAVIASLDLNISGHSIFYQLGDAQHYLFTLMRLERREGTGGRID